MSFLSLPNNSVFLTLQAQLYIFLPYCIFSYQFCGELTTFCKISYQNKNFLPFNNNLTGWLQILMINSIFLLYYLTNVVWYLIWTSQDLTLTNISDLVEASYVYSVILTLFSLILVFTQSFSFQPHIPVFWIHPTGCVCAWGDLLPLRVQFWQASSGLWVSMSVSTWLLSAILKRQ